MDALPFLAVHISDGVLRREAWIAFTVAAGMLVAFSARSVSDGEIPRLSLLTAAVFAASQIHVPVSGTSVHLLMNALTGIILGRRAPVAIAVAVFLQALLFAHGGLTTWGINTLTMSLPALFAGWLFRITYRNWPKTVFVWGLLAGLSATLNTLFLAAVAIYVFGVDSAWIVTVVMAAHMPVIAIESLLTATVAQYLAKVKPEWLGVSSITLSFRKALGEGRGSHPPSNEGK